MRRGDRSGLQNHCGFSVTELTTVLTALTILTGAVAPAVNDYVEDAKLVRARHDVSTLGVTLVRLFNDVGFEREIKGGWATYDLLVGSGAVPDTTGRGTDGWIAPVGTNVGLLDDQLIRNTAGYTRYDGRWHFGWRGAYLQNPVSPDPWGHRYAVNMRAMRSSHWDTVVLTAGPNGLVESPFELDGLPTGGDDIVSLASSGGGWP